MKRSMLIGGCAATLLAVAGYGMYRLGEHSGMQAGAGNADLAAGGSAESLPARKILYWHDPMVPAQRFDKPGKSPFMDMQLVPVYADEASEASGVTIDPRVQQNLGLRTALVESGSLASAVTAAGNVAYNEREVEVVQARATGYVERLFVRAVLDPVRAGQVLAELYVPDWVAAQEDYLATRRMTGPGADELRQASLQRMRQAGMTDAQIRLVESTGQVHARLPVVAPAGGVVSELSVREGTTITAGAPMFRINGLDKIWVNAEIAESQAGQIRPGTRVEAETPSAPGIVFKGRVSALLPEIDPATRTLRARIEMQNRPESRNGDGVGPLLPGMFMTVHFARAASKPALLVPSEAVIQTGLRAVVMVAGEHGNFTPVEVTTGAEGNGKTEILKGLSLGQKVVISGQFLVDSEASLKGTQTRMTSPTAGEPAAATQEKTR